MRVARFASAAVRRCAAVRGRGSSAAAWRSDAVVLGIESSCDDTGVALVTGDGRVLGSALATQVRVGSGRERRAGRGRHMRRPRFFRPSLHHPTQADLHAPWGGVVPALASQAHAEAMDAVLDAALADAGVGLAEVTAVAATVGPGLSLCLRVGTAKAEALAAQLGVPLVPVHHLEAHCLVARLNDGRRSDGDNAPPPPLVPFPYITILASGGHNTTLLVRGVGDYVALGSTLDDALGEAFDKVARMLGLDPRPSGGAAVEAAATRGDPHAFKFTPPLLGRPGANVSYAGLKTAVRMAAEAAAPGPPTDANAQTRADVAASFQRVAIAHLVDRATVGARWALEAEPGVGHIVLAGGVACNKAVRSAFEAAAASLNLTLVTPPPSLCTDNGVMVAWAGVERLAAGVAELPRPEGSPEPRPEGWVDVRPRWPLTSITDTRALRSAPQARSARKARVYEDLSTLTAAVRDGFGGGAARGAPDGARGAHRRDGRVKRNCKFCLACWFLSTLYITLPPRTAAHHPPTASAPAGHPRPRPQTRRRPRRPARPRWQPRPPPAQHTRLGHGWRRRRRPRPRGGGGARWWGWWWWAREPLRLRHHSSLPLLPPQPAWPGAPQPARAESGTSPHARTRPSSPTESTRATSACPTPVPLPSGRPPPPTPRAASARLHREHTCTCRRSGRRRPRAGCRGAS